MSKLEKLAADWRARQERINREQKKRRDQQHSQREIRLQPVEAELMRVKEEYYSEISRSPVAKLLEEAAETIEKQEQIKFEKTVAVNLTEGMSMYDIESIYNESEAELGSLPLKGRITYEVEKGPGFFYLSAEYNKNHDPRDATKVRVSPVDIPYYHDGDIKKLADWLLTQITERNYYHITPTRSQEKELDDHGVFS